MVGGRMNRADCVEHTTSSYLVLPVHLYGEVARRGGYGEGQTLVIKAGGGHEDQSWFRIEDWRGHWGRLGTAWGVACIVFWTPI